MRLQKIWLAAFLGVSALGGCASTGTSSAVLAPVGGAQAAAYAVGLSADPAPPLRLGEAAILRLRASAPSHGALYLLHADGGVTILSERLALDAQERRFPPEGAGFSLRVAPPAGEERVILIGSSAPLPPAGSGFGVPQALPGVSHAAFLADLERRLASSGALWSRAELRLETRP